MDVPPADPAAITTSVGTRDLTDSPLLPDPSADVEELDSFNPLEPPPLDWRSESSSEEEDSAADNLTDFTDSLDKASPHTPTLFPTDATDNVERQEGEEVRKSPVSEKCDNVYAANLGNELLGDLDKEEARDFNQPAVKIFENVCPANLDAHLVSDLDKEEDCDFNQEDASTSRENAIIWELHSNLDVTNNQSTVNIFPDVCVANLDNDLINTHKQEARNFNQPDASDSQESTTDLEEHRSLDFPDNRSTTEIIQNVYAANLDQDLSNDLDKEDQFGATNCAKQEASQDRATNLEAQSSFEPEFKESYSAIEDSQAAVRNNLRHLGYEIGHFGFDETQIGKNESEFEGKDHYQVRNSDLNNTGEHTEDYLEDEDHSHIHSLLNQLQLRGEEQEAFPSQGTPPQAALEARPSSPDADETTGLLFAEDHQRHVIGLLQCSELPESRAAEVDAVVSVSYSQEDTQRYWGRRAPAQAQREDSFSSQPDDEEPEPVWMKLGEEPPDQDAAAGTDMDAEEQPSYKDVPGPCDPEDLLDGVIFGAKYLGSTQLRSDRTPSTNARMAQAQEAVDRIKAPEGETQPMTEVDLFISTKRIKVLTADTQEAMMDHSLQMISYIADIGEIVVLMARRKRKGAEGEAQKKCLMICHVFTSEDAQVIAQAIGQAFGVAYQQFLQVNGIRASELRPGEYSHYLESQELYNGDLAHFSDAHNLKEIAITKPPGEMLGLAVVESGWGSILPTVVVANMLHGGPAERCGELSIGDRIMSVNGTSLVGLPIHTCQNIIRDLKSQKYVKLSIVHCPPVTMAIIRRPDPKYQLGFSVEDGIICSLMRGGIAERGGIRVGHRIIEINGQSVVATTHDKIIQTLTNAVGEIHLKTMPASTYRLLTGQEQPVYL